MIKLGIDNNWLFVKNSFQACLMIGLGLYLWYNVGLPTAEIGYYLFSIVYVFIFGLICLHFKDAIGQLYFFEEQQLQRSEKL